MLRFRASLAFVLSAALAASPAFAARAHHARTSGHASASSHTSTSGGATSKRTSSRSSHASANDGASSRHTRVSRHASTRDRASDNSSVSQRTSSRRHARRGSSRVVAVAAPTHRLRGQQAIDPARVTEIQQALIREHYFTGEADGQWDETTKAAMQKYQADQGWQTKLMPDSRALKKLGLGPDYSTAINAKDSSFAAPPPTSTIPSVLSAGFAAGAGVNQ